MKVNFTQVYVEPGVEFPFTHHFQQRMSERVTALVAPSEEFITRFGSDFELVFYVSARSGLQKNEIRGPSVFRANKGVEYSIFLPFDVISKSKNVIGEALIHLLAGVDSVLQMLGIETGQLEGQRDALIAEICADSTMTD